MTTNITNLNGLNVLTAIGGDLSIGGNDITDQFNRFGKYNFY